MPYGSKKVFVTPLDTVDTSDLEGVGTVRREGDEEYVYCKGVASTVLGSVAVIHEDYTTALLTTALGAVPRRVGVALAATVASRWGWYQIRGQCAAVYMAASAAANVQLFTDTSTDGGVDDTATSEHAVLNLWAKTVVGGTAANTDAYLFYPHTVPGLD